ncbi:MAG: hypothetical protein OIN86_17880 [Candidatus Methanoperedens sp.]|nr:hypothetical protein [Candidatus Methanoperedens sp.]CAG0953160.1 hypothetical protein METP1_00303 [Methanosarcinales archaeon]
MKIKNKVSIAVAVAFLGLGMILSNYPGAVSSGILSGTFAVGLSMLFVSLYKHFKYGDGVEQDERTRKVMYRALAGSWFATLVLLTVLMFADRFDIILDIRGMLSIVFFFMVFTFSTFNWYFEGKGDM